MRFDITAKTHIILRVKLSYARAVFAMFRSGFMLPAMLAIAPAMLAAGCSHTAFSIFPDRTVAETEKYVRTAKIYRNMDTILIADILWHNPDVKRLHVKRMGKQGRIDAGDEKRMLLKIGEMEEKELEFLAGIYTGEDKWNDFQKNDSIWKIRLRMADGSKIAPGKIEKLKVKDMPDSRLFPFITPWKMLYRITFERTKEISQLKNYNIEIYSFLGNAEFSWDVE